MATSELASPPAPQQYRKKRIRWLDVKEQLTGYVFILPAVAIIGLFGFFPIGYAIYMSLYNWRVRKAGFIGDDNYIRAIGDWGALGVFALGFVLLLVAYLAWEAAGKASREGLSLGWKGAAVTLSKKPASIALRLGTLAGVVIGLYTINRGWELMHAAKADADFLHSLPVTLFYSLGTVPAELALALVLAYILFQKIRGKELFRMIYFLPYITPAVATALVFRTIFNARDTSLANQVVGLFNLGPFKWLFEPRSFTEAFFGLKLPEFWAGPSMALVSIILFGIWTYVGYNTVIFLAGLGSIPHELYEAAEIDGAGRWQSFRHITLPLLSPVTFYLAIVAFIGTFKAFNHLYVMRVPSAQDTVNVASVSIFDTFYKANNYGYAAAQAILLFLIILGLTFVQNRVFGKKVFYG